LFTSNSLDTFYLETKVKDELYYSQLSSTPCAK